MKGRKSKQTKGNVDDGHLWKRDEEREKGEER